MVAVPENAINKKIVCNKIPVYYSNRNIMNKLVYSIVLFLVLFTIIHMTKPALMYLPNGAFRPFGLGYKQKTVVPIWVAAIILAVLCYLLMFYLEKHHRF